MNIKRILLYSGYLYGVLDLKEVEEGPYEGDDEGGDDDKEEEVVVPQPVVVGVPEGLGRGRTGHAHYTQHLRGGA